MKSDQFCPKSFKSNLSSGTFDHFKAYTKPLMGPRRRFQNKYISIFSVRTANGPRTEPNGDRSDPERIPNGPRTDPVRTPYAPRTDPARTPRGPRADPARTPRGPRTDSERAPNGPRTDPERTPGLRNLLRNAVTSMLLHFRRKRREESGKRRNERGEERDIDV